mmetsp:Transcript_11015/g.30848  ORF Transcript_11015/g.30848 Transcript_11015/m.30848 type:complete len:211 (-) Transcript_11015:905-1537(-)
MNALEPHCDGLLVGLETLHLGHDFHGGAQALETLLAQALDRDLLQEGVQGDPRVHLGVAIRWEGVVRPARVVSHALWGPPAQEDASRILYHVQAPLRPLHVHDQVLRGIDIRELASLLQGVHPDRERVSQGLGGGLVPRQLRQLGPDLLLHLFHVHPFDGDEDGLRVRPVLCLGQDVRRHVGGVGAPVRDDEHLARPGRHVYGHHRLAVL